MTPRRPAPRPARRPARRRAALLAAALALSPLAAPAAVPEVATDIPPVHSLVAQVMDGLGSPGLLMDQGADAHDYQMRPSQARALAGADLLFWIGPEMTPWLARAVEGGSGGRAVALLAAPGTTLRDFAPGDGGAAGHAGDGEGDHDHHAGTDPHAWLDAGNAALWLELIAAELAAADPANAAAYAANAAAAKARIAAIDAELAARLAPAKDRPVVFHHAALGYFAARYGLTVAGSLAPGDAAAPGAARLSEIRAALAGVACIFPEAEQDAGLVAAVAEGTGARVGGALDPEGRALPPGPELYGDLLRALGQTIADCLAPA